MTTTTTTVEALRETAIRLGVEAAKTLRSGDFEAPVRQLAHEAFEAAHAAGARIGDMSDEIDLRYATYLLQTLQPGFVETIAFDGDLDLTGAAA